MYNFISTFDELNKLYEEADAKKAKQDEKIKEACVEELTEAAEDEAVENEVPVEEIPAEDPVVDEEPRQVICECDKCGALVIKDEADIVVDEETDLVNVEDECQFCEEAKGYKIVGVVAPYEVAEDMEESLTEEAKLRAVYVLNQEAEFDSLNDAVDAIESASPIDKSAEATPEVAVSAVEDETDIIDEDLADIYRKTFDKPASISTQAAWEDRLNDDSISDKERKHLEKKFAQQRDWEARHPDKEVK